MLFHHCIHMKSMINKGYEKLFYSFHIWWKTMLCILVEESWKNLLRRDKQLISSASYYKLGLKAKFSTVNGVFC